MRSSIRLALIQMLVSPGDAAGNRARALRLIEQAAQQRVDIVLLPEALPCGWTDPSCQTDAGEIPDGGFCKELAEAALTHGVYVCSGLIERDGERVFNSAVLINPSGEVMLKHRKLYELDIAHDCYALGDRLGVAETEFGRVGVMICADGFAPGQVISRALAMMGARLILSPCAWAVPSAHDNRAMPYGQLWLDNYQPVAREFDVAIAGCSNVGPIRAGAWAGHRCIGCSMVIGPGGKEILRGPYGEHAEEILIAQVELGNPRRPRPD